MIGAPMTSLQGVACLLPRAAHTARSRFPIWRGNGAPKCQTEMPCSPASLAFHSFFPQSHSFSQCLLTTHHVPGLAPDLGGELTSRAVGTHPKQPRTNRTTQRAGGPDGNEWGRTLLRSCCLGEKKDGLLDSTTLTYPKKKKKSETSADHMVHQLLNPLHVLLDTCTHTPASLQGI